MRQLRVCSQKMPAQTPRMRGWGLLFQPAMEPTPIGLRRPLPTEATGPRPGPLESEPAGRR